MEVRQAARASSQRFLHTEGAFLVEPPERECDLVLALLSLAWPTFGAANESAPDKPIAATVINKRKAKERKFRFMILIIEILLACARAEMWITAQKNVTGTVKQVTRTIAARVVIHVCVVCRAVWVVDSKIHSTFSPLLDLILWPHRDRLSCRQQRLSCAAHA
jgi:hypothetical protein